MPRTGNTFRIELDPAPLSLDAPVRQWLEQQLNRLASSVNQSSDGVCQVLNAAPAKPVNGMIRFADGSNWNPGKGRGYYAYDETAVAWQYLGGAAVPSIAFSQLTDTIITTPATGSVPVWTGTAWIDELLLLHGQCRFDYVSATVTRLSRYDGKYIIINGILEVIPSAGVDLANTALGANDTTYYVYVYMNSGTMTLEVSTTGFAVDATTGVNIKSADATRTLVGMVRKTGGNFVSTTNSVLVASWFNRRKRSVYGTTSGNTTSGTAVAVGTSPLVSWLMWGGATADSFTLMLSGWAANDTAGAYTQSGFWLNGANNGMRVTNTSSIAGAFHNIGYPIGFPPTVGVEGYNTCAMSGLVSAGTGTWGHITISTDIVS